MKGHKFATSVAAAALLLAFSGAAAAKPTAYLPIGYDVNLEQQLDRMFVQTTGTPMSKPYRFSDIDKALAQLKEQNPALFSSINAKLIRYRGEDNITRAGVTLRYEHDQTTPLANQRGLTTDEWGQVMFEGIWRPNDLMLMQVGLEFRAEAGDLVPYNTFVAIAGEDLQLNIGYKEHWFSPFKTSAQMISTNAKASPSISLGMVAPAHNWWNFDFELFYTELEEVKEGIRYQGEWHDGKPRVAGTHISLEPLSGWKLGFNRIMQFGGGPREVDFGDVLDAFFDPAGSDNSYSEEERETELGDQLASVTSTFYFDWGMPTEIYFEYGGEDTQGGSNFSLGNQVTSFGAYLPQLTSDVALRYEYNKWKTSWYTNGLYKFGNTNDGFVFGHYAGDRRIFGDGVPAEVHALVLDYQQDMDSLWQLKLTLQDNDSAQYSGAQELQLLNSSMIDGYRVETQVTYGNDVFDESYGHASVSLYW
ncbi:capsule assembly Wzi family protein [Pseudoalteromonas sp. T1lg22]|uniref:capsule assembly Wzi family protein n=1 Tax=Pseudoalteromonas sp. T1lg22 TaxID=2077096 RepID=UPI000CF69CF7|nr:capsule assembly Wzi family protein [Pseudoalteromonas sp. T1lg22]